MNSEESSPSVDKGNTGKQLRQARESAGLTVTQVAENQHLRPSIIQAIEEGDYSQIDSELFLKGYVRTYAGIVGLNADSLVASLDKELEPLRRENAAAEEVNPLHDIERRKRQKARIAKSVMFILALVVLGLLAYRFVPPMMEETAPQPSGESEPAIEEQESPFDEGQVEPSEEAEDPAPQLGRDRDGELAEADAGLQIEASEEDVFFDREADSEIDSENEDISASGADFNSAVTEESNTGEQPETDIVSEPVSESPGSASEGLASSLFTASFIDDCWVQVTDARGRTLVSALRRAGERISVDGIPPLRIVLGAADAVEQLEFAGESVDLSSYRIINNRVEFTLDV